MAKNATVTNLPAIATTAKALGHVFSVKSVMADAERAGKALQNGFSSIPMVIVDAIACAIKHGDTTPLNYIYTLQTEGEKPEQIISQTPIRDFVRKVNAVDARQSNLLHGKANVIKFNAKDKRYFVPSKKDDPAAVDARKYFVTELGDVIPEAYVNQENAAEAYMNDVRELLIGIRDKKEDKPEAPKVAKPDYEAVKGEAERAMKRIGQTFTEEDFVAVKFMAAMKEIVKLCEQEAEKHAKQEARLAAE